MIDLKELKQKIETNTLDTHLVIYKCDKQSEFIPHQYAIEFCGRNKSEIVHITSSEEFPVNTLFNDGLSKDLYVYFTESLTEDLNVEQEETAQHFIWVICNKINAKCKKQYAENIVEVPKFQEWQIKDFITSRCPKLKSTEIDELYNYYKHDLFRLDNELTKLSLVGETQYQKVKNQLYVDVSNFNVFDIVNSVVKKDTATISNIYQEIENIDIDSFGLITLLINNFRYIIDIQLARNATAESVGISGKQFWAIKNYSCGYYSKQELISIFKFLNSLDYKIKSGMLDTTNLVDYVLCKILTV